MRSPSKRLLLLAVLPLAACAREVAPVVTSAEPAAPVQTPPANESRLEITYLANEGFLVSGGEHRVLIDALFGDGIVGYDAVPPAVRTPLEQGVGEWAGVEVAIASHYHADHFDPEAVARFLTANPAAKFVSTPQAKAKFVAAAPDLPELRSRFEAVLPDPGAVASLDVGEVRIEAINLHHGRRDPPVENLGVIVTLDGKRFLHFGDTEAKMEDFAPHLERLSGTDVALLPFWFLSSQWRAEMVRDRIGPGRIAVAHMPRRDAPALHFARWRNYDGLVSAIEQAFPDAWLPRATGDVMP